MLKDDGEKILSLCFPQFNYYVPVTESALCVHQKQASKTLCFTTSNSLESELCPGQFVGVAWCEGLCSTMRTACSEL